MSGSNEIAQVLASPKLGVTVSTMTAGTGLANWLDWIPDDIGKLATLIGIGLSVVLIRVHLLTVKKLKMEMAVIAQKEAERCALADARRRTGLPTRRADDPD